MKLTTEELLLKIEAYIDARIEEKIEYAFGRDSLHESMRASELLGEIRMSLNLNEFADGSGRQPE